MAGKQTDPEKDRIRGELSERIRSFRMSAGLTQLQVAESLNVTKNAVTNWESGASRPDLSYIPQLCALFGISADMLFGIKRQARALSRAEKDHVSLYRQLSGCDQENVDVLMRSMIRGYEQTWLQENQDRFLRIPQFQLAFAAGSGHPLDETSETEYCFIRRSPESDMADFIVTVNGHSMEPTLNDGDRVFVEKRTRLLPGEIGIFRLPDGDGIIKEYREDGLHSHNPAYALRTSDELAGAVCLGHVLGTVEESLVPSSRQAALLSDVFRTQRRPALHSL